LDGLTSRDWASAEKRFADCLRRDPENVPSLNNLAIAQFHNKREAQAVKHWKTILEQRAATPEVVQNLGRFRHLIKEGTARGSSALVKSLDELYTEASVATSWSFQPQAGFRLMALALADGRQVGWNDVRKMEVQAAASAVSGSSPATPSQSGGAIPGTPAPGASTAGPVRRGPIDPRMPPGATGPAALGRVDPRMQPANPYQPGAAGYASPGANMPVIPRPSRRPY
jgi:hypothetical protein